MSTSSNYYQLLTMNTTVGPVTLSHCLFISGHDRLMVNGDQMEINGD